MANIYVRAFSLVSFKLTVRIPRSKPMLMTWSAYSCTAAFDLFAVLRFSVDSPLYIEEIVAYFMVLPRPECG